MLTDMRSSTDILLSIIDYHIADKINWVWLDFG